MLFSDPGVNKIREIHLEGIQSTFLVVDSHDGTGDGLVEINEAVVGSVEVDLDGNRLTIRGSQKERGDRSTCSISITGGLDLVGSRIAPITMGLNLNISKKTPVGIRLVLPPGQGIHVYYPNGELRCNTPLSLAQRVEYIREVKIPGVLVKAEEKALAKEKKAVRKRDAKLAKAREKEDKAVRKRDAKLAKAERKEQDAKAARQAGKAWKVASKRADARVARQEAASVYQECMREAAAYGQEAQQVYDTYMAEAAHLRAEAGVEVQRLSEIADACERQLEE